jgi:UDP-N-acetyl-D-mannosaminuronic acid transferase (WecB/TagA/CpsF family)
VAGRATNFTFENWVMGAFVCFNLDITMTAETDLRFVGLLSAADMKVMTGVAGNIISFVDTHIP